MDNPCGCGISPEDGKKLCLCLFCIKGAESGWAAGKNPGPLRRTGGRKMQERRRGRSQTGPRAFARGARIQDVSLIRPFGPPYPFCPSGTFPPDRGNRPSPWKGEGLRAAKGRPKREGEIFWDGRVRTPAPTKFGESSGFAVGADDLGGPRAHRECSLGEGIPPPLRGTPL